MLQFYTWALFIFVAVNDKCVCSRKQHSTTFIPHYVQCNLFDSQAIVVRASTQL